MAVKLSQLLIYAHSEMQGDEDLLELMKPACEEEEEVPDLEDEHEEGPRN